MYKIYNSKFKNLIVAILICNMLMLSFPQKANANPAIIVGGFVVTTEMLVTLAGATLVAGGATLYANTDSTDLKYIAQGIINTGQGAKDVAIKIDAQGRKFLSWTKEGLTKFSEMCKSFISSGVTVTEMSGTYNFDYDNVKKDFPYIVCSISVPANVPLLYGSKILYLEGTSCTMSLGGAINRSGRLSFYGTASGMTYYFSENVGINEPFDLSKLHLGESICSGNIMAREGVRGADLDSIPNVFFPDNSVDGNPSIDVPIGQSVDGNPSIGVPIGQSVDGEDYVPNIDIPYGKTWGDIAGDLGISYPKEKETDIPKEDEKDIPKEDEKDIPKEDEKDIPKEDEKDIPKEDEKDIPKEKDWEIPKDVPKLDFKPLINATRKFPFCIPWDMVACIKVFEGNEQPFAYEFNQVCFNGPSTCGQSIVVVPHFKLDFSEYPAIVTAIKVLKFLEFIIFVMWLCTKTRNLIRG